MNTFKLLSPSADSTIEFGKSLARHLRTGDIVCLFGDLGSGKTTLVKGIAKGLSISPVKVHSPTFVLMNLYEGKLPLYHFDFYRLEAAQEIASIGYEEFLYDEGVAVIEWADRFGSLMPKEYLKIGLTHKGENKREIKAVARGGRYNKIIERLK